MSNENKNVFDDIIKEGYMVINGAVLTQIFRYVKLYIYITREDILCF